MKLHVYTLTLSAISWLILVVLLSFFALFSGPKLDSSIMSLLPKSEQNALVQTATEHMAEQFSKRVLLLISSPDTVKARNAVTTLALSLSTATEIAEINWQIDDQDVQDLHTQILPYRFAILDPKIRSLLVDNEYSQISNIALMHLFSPLSSSKSTVIDDPFSLFTEYTQNKTNTLNIQLDHALMKVSSRKNPTYLMVLTLVDQPFSPTVQQQVLGALHTHQQQLQQSGVTLTISGMLVHAELGARQANKEISTIGIGSLIGIVVLLLVVFKSIKPLFLILFPIVIGCVTAASVTTLIFGHIHLITLAFGAGLVGVSVDYSLHYLCERRVSNSRTTLHKILPGLCLGLFSSVIAYTAQSLSPFPGLQQMAVFSAVGLIASWLTVVFWFPLLTHADPLKPLSAAHSLKKVLSFIPSLAGNNMLRVLLFILVGLSLNSIIPTNDEDSLRLLQTSPEGLLAHDKAVQTTLNSSSSTQFLLIKGHSLEDNLIQEEQVSPALDTLIQRGQLEGYQALSQHIPSIQRQDDNVQRVSQLYQLQLASLYDKIKLSNDTLIRAQTVFNQDSQHRLTAEQWLQFEANHHYDHLRIHTATELSATVIRFTGDISAETKQALQQLAVDNPNIEFIDQIQNISDLMSHFRSEMTNLVILAYLLVIVILLLRYKTQAWRIILPPLLASIFTLALIGHIEHNINLFNLMALILVLGIGLDMGIFLSEPSDKTHTWLAVSLSSFTSLLAFGLLAFSTTPVLHHFGLTVLIGLSCVWVLAPMMRQHSSGDMIK
jgi:predicted exporter